jgi:motility quorum-sensing regulator/GCU-specific mRNA interferase toxin
MEKRRPHYDLPTLKEDVARLGAAAFTSSALDGGRSMGLTLLEMLTCISAIQRGDFFKSNTTVHDHTVWQDVYRPWFGNGKQLYVKVTYRPQGGPPVISFKER